MSRLSSLRRMLVRVAVLTGLLALAGVATATVVGHRGPPHGIFGTPHADTLVGTAGADRISGGGGNDTIRGAGGSDILIGGRGRDVLDGGPGDDRIDARDHNVDTISCGPGHDTVLADFQDEIVPGQCETILGETGRQTAMITVSVPSGGGVVRSTPARLACPPRCSARFEVGRKVTLRAIPAAGYEFVDWTSSCKDAQQTCAFVPQGGAFLAASFTKPGPQPQPAPTGGRNVVLTDQKWVCTGAVDLDVVKVTMHAGDDAISLESGCTGHIRRLEVDTWTDDGFKVQNDDNNAAHDLVIDAGYITCHDIQPGYHQDGVQMMGGARLTFRNMTIDCQGNSNFFISKGGLAATVPADGVCDHCLLLGRSSTTFRIDESLRSGARFSLICPGVYFPKYFVPDKAVDPLDRGNVYLSAGDPRCHSSA
jgi:hypothetical protein